MTNDDARIRLAERVVTAYADAAVDHDLHTIFEAVVNEPGGRGSVMTHIEDHGEEVFSFNRRCLAYARSTCRLFVQYDQHDDTDHWCVAFSDEYTRLSMVDLVTGRRVDEPWPMDADGLDCRDMGFCPIDVRMMDMSDLLVDRRHGHMHHRRSVPEQADRWVKMIQLSEDMCDHALMHTGSWGLEAGYFWGDDATDKIRRIDASRLRQGILSCDQRYGYIELDEHATLQDVLVTPDQLVIPSIRRVDLDGRVMMWPSSDE